MILAKNSLAGYQEVVTQSVNVKFAEGIEHVCLTTPPLDDLEQLAKAAQAEVMPLNYSPAEGSEYARFMKAITPTVVLAWIAETRALRPGTEPMKGKP